MFGKEVLAEQKAILLVHLFFSVNEEWKDRTSDDRSLLSYGQFLLLLILCLPSVLQTTPCIHILVL